ncbi:phosphoglycerate mutase-like protein [Apiospora phragmitis]|uniref:Phosphoglycerate mutase-like protein n=1 Tax=Apiospora phragmitis TaxID=2905665 RepID=A0ABR1VCI1_9PEZI
MPATIWLIRHAQGIHNVTQNWDLVDPELTQLGEDQARDFYNKNAQKMNGKIAAIFASPSLRTIQTAILCFSGPIHEGKRISLDPYLMELELLKFFGDNISIANISTPEYQSRAPESRFRDDQDAVRARAHRARESLYRLADSLRYDEIIAVVSHFHMLRALVGGESGEDAVNWKNCQMLQYRFVQDEFAPVKQYQLQFSPSYLKNQRAASISDAPPESSLLSPPPTPDSGYSGLRSILKRVHGDGNASSPGPRKSVSWSDNLEIQHDFSKLTRMEFAVARKEFIMADLSPQFQYNIERLTPVTLLRARQLGRYCSIYTTNHGFPAVMLEQAEVLQPDAWSHASPDERTWPDEWHPSNPDMPGYQAAFLNGWRQVFPGAW